MNHYKTLITIIGLFLGSWIMICEPATCGANQNFTKGANTPRDSNLTRSAQTQFRVDAPATNRRLAQNSANKQPSPDALTLEKLRNAKYKSDHYGNGPVRLNNGRHETKIYPDSETMAFIELTDKIAFGDLNGDGAQDAAVILLSSGGGSGGFFELAAMVNQNGTPVQAGLQYLGDRVDIKSIAIKSGTIVIDMLTHGPNDAQCCPTVRQTQRYRLDGGSLVRLQ